MSFSVIQNRAAILKFLFRNAKSLQQIGGKKSSDKRSLSPFVTAETNRKIIVCKIVLSAAVSGLLAAVRHWIVSPRNCRHRSPNRPFPTANRRL